MTKDQLQAELKEQVQPGIKPSHIRKSKSLDNLPTASSPITPLQKSKSQLEIPLPQQPNKDQQISSLQDELTIERQRVSSCREDLAREQEKKKQLKGKQKDLADQILQLRLDKIKEFSEYFEKKKLLESELELNITAGISEIKRLENKLTATNKKKLELAQKLGTAESKQAQLELELLNNSTPPAPAASLIDDYWPLILLAGTYLFSAWLLSKNTPRDNH